MVPDWTATDSGTRGHNESKSDSVDVTVHFESGPWIPAVPYGGSCDPDSTHELRWPQDEPLEDSYGNTFEIWCVGYFSYLYNGTEFASCIWHYAYNDSEYRLTPDGRLHSIRHSTFHRCNNDPQNCSQGCDGYYCWKVTYKDCIGGDVTTWWRRSATQLEEYWEDDGEEDPYGPGTRHP